jgi:hypothetical protein
MGFWEEHEEREAALRPPPGPNPQNLPAECRYCGVEDTDVLLGTCGLCMDAFEERLERSLRENAPLLERLANA